MWTNGNRGLSPAVAGGFHDDFTSVAVGAKADARSDDLLCWLDAGQGDVR
jgi:hypothetical protein